MADHVEMRERFLGEAPMANEPNPTPKVEYLLEDERKMLKEFVDISNDQIYELLSRLAALRAELAQCERKWVDVANRNAQEREDAVQQWGEEVEQLKSELASEKAAREAAEGRLKPSTPWPLRAPENLQPYTLPTDDPPKEKP